VIAGVREVPAHRLNAAFERHVRTGRPYVIWKTASSLDGKTAATDGTSRWITSPEARADAHRWRAWADAIVVGSRTALADDPALTVRDVPSSIEARPPMRVLVDSAGRVPVGGALTDGAAPTIVATTERMPDARADGWIEAGVDVAILPADVAGAVDLGALVAHLGKRDVQGLLLEGGATLAWSFVRDDLVDRVIAYVAPALVGGTAAPGILAGGGFAPIDAARRFAFTDVARVGPDIRVEADVHRDR
jgi:diaminohydroxyphosphoribosylaminopyrimidine deaminase/5-amino-6-(5-phosphoribosylamino)uracil reductase